MTFVNPAAAILALTVVSAALVGRAAYRRGVYERTLLWLVMQMDYEIVEPPPEPETTILIRGMTVEEWRVKHWRTWLCQFWVAWEHLEFCGRKRFMERAYISRAAWDAAMEYVKALKLAEIKPRHDPVVLVSDKDAALDIIRHKPLIPLPRQPAPDRIGFKNPFEIADSPDDDLDDPENGDPPLS